MRIKHTKQLLLTFIDHNGDMHYFPLANKAQVEKVMFAFAVNNWDKNKPLPKSTKEVITGYFTNGDSIVNMCAVDADVLDAAYEAAQVKATKMRGNAESVKKAAVKAEKIVDTTKTVEKIVDTANTAEQVVDATTEPAPAPKKRGRKKKTPEVVKPSGDSDTVVVPDKDESLDQPAQSA